MTQEFFDAIKDGNRDEVERRLNLDPSLIHVKENHLSPIMVAAYHHEPEIASFLADKTVAINIFEASATGKINNVIRQLAREPQLVNSFSEDGFQPLGLASYFGHLELARYLIKAGAPINSPSRNGLKAAPIQSAAAAGHEKIVQLLMQLGADPNIREGNGYTPLHAAAQNKDVQMIRTLIYGGADITVVGSDGKAPLDIAIETGDKETIAVLTEGITKRLKPKRE
jgi:ankyrin repeat protein